MNRWVIKWNRNDTSLPGKAHDWADAFDGPRLVECYGRAEGRGGETLSSLAPGNVALAYQSDDRSFYGIVRIITVNSLAKPAFAVVDRVHRFERPVRLATIAAQEPLLQEANAFRTGSALDNFRRITLEEYRLILNGCGVDAAARAELRI
jgi:hypothetical protein